MDLMTLALAKQMSGASGGESVGASDIVVAKFSLDFGSGTI